MLFLLLAAAVRASDSRSICGDTDYSRDAACYYNDEKVAEAAKPILRVGLWFEDTYLFTHCTAFMVGSEGHFLTNAHCVQGEAENLANLRLEAGAEGSCDDPDCKVDFGCAGPVVFNLTGASLVKKNEELDYALIKLGDDQKQILSPYGFLAFRGFKEEEEIFVVGHPWSYGKRIAMYRDSDESVCTAHRNASIPHFLEHDADTISGSSGSPIISKEDYNVVGIHWGGGCENSGVNMGTDAAAIARDLGDLLPKDAYLDELIIP